MAKLNVRFVFEVLGRPPEHVKEALETVVTKLGSEKGVSVIDKTYHPPTKVEDSDNLHTAFAEVETELESLSQLFGLIFAYFPANIEIMSPSNIKMTNSELNELSNNLVGRLHHYDSITKKVLAERTILIEKLKEQGVELKFGPPEENKVPEKKKNKGSKKKSK